VPHLEEKDFIHEEYSKNPRSFWRWLAIVVTMSCLFLGASLLYFSMLSRLYKENPFLQVTNRQLSLFLWQHPQHMRVHVQHKANYLPAFHYAEKIGLEPTLADEFAIAPPELLFLYHTWKRLLGNIYFPRKIVKQEFQQFLSASPEWQPRYWKQAPDGYVRFIASFAQIDDTDLNQLNESILPLEIRQAFTGWKNYFFEGGEINALSPSYEEIEQFLELQPHYRSNYWCNIVGESYLKSFKEEINKQGAIPIDELSSFLRVAFYNYVVGQSD